MDCEQISELLADHLRGSLSQAQRAQVEEHIAFCTECSEQVAIWQKLALLPIEHPTAASRERFETMLEAYRSGRAEHNASSIKQGDKLISFWNVLRWVRSPAGALAWSVVLLAAGVFLGTLVSRSSPRAEDLAAMHAELANMRQLVALSMLQQQSASGRLEGVTWTRREPQLEPQVLSALMHTLRYDPSVDVRLAALDALSRHASQPQVHREVADALQQQQQSPLVQVALIDQLLEWRDPEAVQRLHQLEQNPNLNPTVRERAQWAISKLN